MSIIQHDKFTLQLIETNFVKLEIKEGKTIDDNDIHEIYAGYEKLVGDNKYVVAIYANPFSSMTKQAREIAAKDYANEKRQKVAFISDNLSHVLIVSFFIKINKPKTNVKIFKSKDKAYAWLKGESD